MRRKRERAEPDESGRFAYVGLDRVLHEKARLGIVMSLATHGEGLLFGDLKAMCSLTDGNLSRHLDVLREAKLVEIWKGFEGRRPQTLCRMTPEGRKRFAGYLAELERVVADAARGEEEQSRAEKKGRRRRVALPLGWVAT